MPAPRERAEEGDEQARWRSRFADAVAMFRSAGLEVREDDDAPEDYVRRRREWDGRLRALAGAMLYDWREIEPERSTAGR